MNRYTDRSEIMAIGDSMYHGVHSLSLPSWMPAHSTPALVAGALGLPMVVPDPAHNLLWDLTEEIRHGSVLGLAGRMADICRENLAHWQEGVPWSEHEAFDNVAIGGADIADLWLTTYNSRLATFRDLSARFLDGSLTGLGALRHLTDLWFALGTCHTLNPRHRAEQADKSQLDQVRDRQPRTLLINIGSNEGLFDACFMGDIRFGDEMQKGTAEYAARVIRERVETLAGLLAALPSGVERIAFNGLVRPRTVPNLMPDGAGPIVFPGDDYHQGYVARLTDTQPRVTDATLRRYDALIAQVNDTSRQTLASRLGGRAVFVDLYPACDAVDGKHYRDLGMTVPGNGQVLDTRAIESTLSGFQGGFASLDNMHPTIPGYAVIADAVLAALGHPGVTVDKDAAFQADRLLSDFPGWSVFNMQVLASLFVSLARLFLARSGPTATS